MAAKAWTPPSANSPRISLPTEPWTSRRRSGSRTTMNCQESDYLRHQQRRDAQPPERPARMVSNGSRDGRVHSPPMHELVPGRWRASSVGFGKRGLSSGSRGLVALKSSRSTRSGRQRANGSCGFDARARPIGRSGTGAAERRNLPRGSSRRYFDRLHAAIGDGYQPDRHSATEWVEYYVRITTALLDVERRIDRGVPARSVGVEQRARPAPRAGRLGCRPPYGGHLPDPDAVNRDDDERSQPWVCAVLIGRLRQDGFVRRAGREPRSASN